jgi:hypothetical protein
MFLHIIVIDIDQMEQHDHARLPGVLHVLLRLSPLCRCGGPPRSEGAWGPPGWPTPQGCLPHGSAGGRPARRPRLTTRGCARRPGGAQERSSRRWPARHCPNAASGSGRSGQSERRVCASRRSTTGPRLLWCYTQCGVPPHASARCGTVRDPALCRGCDCARCGMSPRWRRRPVTVLGKTVGRWGER